MKRFQRSFMHWTAMWTEQPVLRPMKSPLRRQKNCGIGFTKMHFYLVKKAERMHGTKPGMQCECRRGNEYSIKGLNIHWYNTAEYFSYWPRFTDEIFKIKHVIKGKPNYYTIEDHKREPILGRLYEEELTKTRLDENTTYRIERILKKGRGKALVKFIGYKDPEWIETSDLN